MALWSLTKAEIISRIETILRRLTGQESCTHQEKLLIADAFNAALIDMCMDRGISRWRFIQSDETEDTTSGTAYIDLNANVFNVVSGTVRIEAENATLQAKSLEAIYSGDPGIEATGRPIYYALDSTTDAETMRLRLWPEPDATYTIAYVGESIPDEDSISSFPSWTHACLKDKATANALRDLGLLDQSRIFEASYETRKQNAKANEGHDGPRYINRIGQVSRHRSAHDRLPS
jgi:hypothetical protein